MSDMNMGDPLLIESLLQSFTRTSHERSVSVHPSVQERVSIHQGCQAFQSIAWMELIFLPKKAQRYYRTL